MLNINNKENFKYGLYENVDASLYISKCASEIFANKTRVVYINAYILCRNVEGYDANNANDFKRAR